MTNIEEGIGDDFDDDDDDDDAFECDVVTSPKVRLRNS